MPGHELVQDDRELVQAVQVGRGEARGLRLVLTPAPEAPQGDSSSRSLTICRAMRRRFGVPSRSAAISLLT
jgi:hypothetical protein